MSHITLDAPAPSWLVTNGHLVVGPVSTDLLLRGIVHRRVPLDAKVKQPGWKGWRPVDEVREVSRMLWGGREPAGRPRAADFGEACLLSLQDAIERTRAQVGVIYRDREPHIGLMGSCCHGVDADRVLGLVLSHDDPAIEAARGGRALLGSPYSGVVHRAISARLGGEQPLRAVMLVPVCIQGRLVATFELGRTDHPFRTTDLREVEAIGRGLVALS